MTTLESDAAEDTNKLEAERSINEMSEDIVQREISSVSIISPVAPTQSQINLNLHSTSNGHTNPVVDACSVHPECESIVTELGCPVNTVPHTTTPPQLLMGTSTEPGLSQTARLLTKSPGLSLIAQLVSTEESDSNSSSESSDDSVIGGSDTGPVETEEHLVVDVCPKVKGEIDYRDLPYEEECEISFPSEGKILPIGQVYHYTEKLLIIQAFPDTPAINEGTVLWREDKTSIARVFETFGPVKTPFYSILVPSKEYANSLRLKPGDTVYVVPGDLGLTNYVFTNKLLEEKGCDASWKNDMEVPEEHREFSDDEQESLRKQKKNKKQKPNIRKEGPLQTINGTSYHTNNSGIHSGHSNMGPLIPPQLGPYSNSGPHITPQLVTYSPVSLLNHTPHHLPSLYLPNVVPPPSIPFQGVYPYPPPPPHNWHGYHPHQ